jgi:hypothetical protein
MSEKLKQVDEQDFSINDEILKALTGKVAEMGSAINEGNVQLKKFNELASRLPFFEKRLEAMQDGAREVTQKVEVVAHCVKESEKGLKAGINSLEKEVGTLTHKVSVPAESIGALRQELVNHVKLFEKPFRKEIHYRHILGWPIVVVVLAVMFAVWMFGLWQDASHQLSEKVENDIKYRFVKLSGDSAVQARANAADEAWRADPDQFKKAVETDEELMTVNTVNYMRKMKLDSETRAVKKPKVR